MTYDDYREDLRQLEALMRTDPDARPRNVALPKKTAWLTSDVWARFELLAKGETYARIWWSDRDYYRDMVDTTVSHGGTGRKELIAWHAAQRMRLDEDRYGYPGMGDAETGDHESSEKAWKGLRDARE